VGGFSAAALRRTLRFGDAWQSLHLDGVGTDPSEFALQAAQLKRASDGLIRIWFGEPAEFSRLQQRFAQKVEVPVTPSGQVVWEYLTPYDWVPAGTPRSEEAIDRREKNRADLIARTSGRAATW
jgi:hypothetical protein